MGDFEQTLQKEHLIKKYGDCCVFASCSLLEEVVMELRNDYMEVLSELSPFRGAYSSDLRLQRKIEYEFKNRVHGTGVYKSEFSIGLHLLSKVKEIKWKELICVLNKLQYWTLITNLYMQSEKFERMLQQENGRACAELWNENFPDSGFDSFDKRQSSQSS